MTLLGGTIVLYDGALDYPGPDRLWALVERHRVNILGVSPTLDPRADASRRRPVRAPRPLVAAHPRLDRRALESGAVAWLFDVVGGGTPADHQLLRRHRSVGRARRRQRPHAAQAGAFAGPPPGIAADVVDEQGRPVRNQVGELVVRAPWIGMTRGFWKDAERYLETYWSRFPDVWVHGDWAAIDDDGLWYILGRSDDTIKIAGKRLGPAEVESVLVEHPAVLEAAAIGVPDELKGQALVCFCVLRPGQSPARGACGALKTLVADRLGKPLKPEGDRVRPRSAEDAQRQGHAPRDPRGVPWRRAWRSSSLENPQAVDDIRLARRT